MIEETSRKIVFVSYSRRHGSHRSISDKRSVQITTRPPAVCLSGTVGIVRAEQQLLTAAFSFQISKENDKFEISMEAARLVELAKDLVEGASLPTTLDADGRSSFLCPA
jgi:hypothetical protein